MIITLRIKLIRKDTSINNFNSNKIDAIMTDIKCLIKVL